MTQDEEIIKLLLLLGFTADEIKDFSKQNDNIFDMLPSVNKSKKDLL